MDHYTRSGRPFPRNVYRVLCVAQTGPVTNRVIQHVLMMERRMAGSYLSRCLMRGYLMRSGNIYQLTVAGRHRIEFLKHNDPEHPISSATCDNLTTEAVHQGSAERRLHL